MNKLIETETQFTLYSSPVGELLVSASDGLLTGVSLRREETPRPGWVRDDAAVKFATDQLDAYFAGDLREFTLSLAGRGTPFQQRVWRELTRIPYGELISYAELARRVGVAKGFQAVGQANGRNPLPIFVPCHRVIASGSKLGGYGGGLTIKKWLIAHERRVAGLPEAVWPA